MGDRAKDKEKKDVVERKVTILNAYMAEEEQQKAIEFASNSLNQKDQATERDISMFIKKEADRALGPGRWHCVYGKHFGAFVSYESMKFVHFSFGEHQILLWKHG